MTLEQLERDLWSAEMAVNELKRTIAEYRAQVRPTLRQVENKLNAIETLLSDRGLEERVVGGSGADRSYWTGLSVRYNATTDEIEFCEVAEDGDPDGATVIHSVPFSTSYTEIKGWISAYETEQLLEAIY